MKIASKVKIFLRKVLMTCGSVETDKGALLYDGELEVGVEVFQENAEGEIVPAANGEYVTEEKVIVVEDGKVTEIRDKEDAQEPEEEAQEETPADPDTPANPDPTPDPDQPVEGEAEPADETEQEEQETDEERIARLEASLAEIREGIDQLINAIAGVAQRVDALEAKLKEVEAPGADPAEEGEETEQKMSRIAILKRNKNK